MRKTTPAGRETKVEGIDLETGRAMPSEELERAWSSGSEHDEHLVTMCQTSTDAGTGAFQRVYTMPGDLVGKLPAQVRVEPVSIYFRTGADADIRFGHDIDEENTELYSYAGWLPLALVRHPDGRGRHHAVAIGDRWIGEAHEGIATQPRHGIQIITLNADQAFAELQARLPASVWSDPAPAAWPLTEAEWLTRIEQEMNAVSSTTAALAYDIKAARRQAGPDSAERLESPIAWYTAERLRKTAVEVETRLSIIVRMRLLTPDRGRNMKDD